MHHVFTYIAKHPRREVTAGISKCEGSTLCTCPQPILATQPFNKVSTGSTQRLDHLLRATPTPVTSSPVSATRPPSGYISTTLAGTTPLYHASPARTPSSLVGCRAMTGTRIPAIIPSDIRIQVGTDVHQRMSANIPEAIEVPHYRQVQ